MLFLLLAVCQEPARPAAPPATYTGSELVVREWLTLGAVDARGRRPFRPDAVVARYLVAHEAPAPIAGETLRGESGEASWKARTAGDDGRLGELSYGYAEVASAEPRVALARLEGAGTLYVNGEAHMGDLYGFGLRGVPVALSAGVNRIFVSGVRGSFRLSFAPPPGPLFLREEDATLPSIAMPEPGDPWLGLEIVNASPTDCAEFTLEVGENPSLCAAPQVFRPGPVARGSRRVALRLGKLPGSFPPQAPGEFTLPIVLRWGEHTATSTLTLSWRAASQVFVHTRVSPLDGSVQKFAVRAPASEDTKTNPHRLLLSLHGAGVDCESQAGSYGAKDDFAIVAPTNRRPFGFDWQDWGRLDAYETLAAARALFPEVRDGHVFLGGHSMGGHGTWHLAANDPDAFTALAPSAGWRSFDTYGGRPEGALRALWHAADAASDTESLLVNLSQPSVYVLHGEADDNVPASEGRAMVEALKKAGASRVQSHFEPGAGHWWDDQDPKTGAGCLDWAGFFELFRKHEPTGEVLGIKWVSVDPGVDAEHHWARVEQPLRYGAPFRVSGGGGEGAARFVLATENVRRLALGPLPISVRTLVLDGQEVPYGVGVSAHAYLRREGKWEECAAGVPVSEKSPSASGPLKRAFASDFLLVVPTKGHADENAAALARARFDQAQWSYRGNGDAEIVNDSAFLALDTHLRNAILYGNRDTNAAWNRVVPAGFQVNIARGAAGCGDQEWEGEDLGLLAVGPRADAPGQLFALLGASGVPAERVASTLALFVSGVGYPDYVVFGADVLTLGDGGVRAAGFFDSEWKLQPR
jgi:pimeloyl-ACP methyl ester carboxylesterase